MLPDITTSLDSLVEACGTLEGALRGLTPSLAEARAILGQLGNTLTSSETSLSTTSDSLGTMETRPGAVADRPDHSAEFRHREGLGGNI
ncbi:MAG: hypothetical protein ACLTSX_13445 [Collinsella sp.]